MRKAPKYSIITCVSNVEIYTDCTLSSINKERRNYDIEIIPIINNYNRYSASNALNIGIDVSRSDVLIFAHQDIKLLDNWFKRLDDVIDSMDSDWGILGSAGIALKYKRSDIGRWGGALKADTVAVGTVYEADGQDIPYWNGTKETEKVHCIDECLFVMRKSTGIRFDSMFNGFHFYGVDACLQARAAGYGVYAADLPIIHYGKYSASFTGDQRYWHFYRILHRKWGKRFPELLGTHMHWAKNEMTSYIPTSMEDDYGHNIMIKAAGLMNVRFAHDENS